MAFESFRFRPTIARRLPDPNFKKVYNSERHLFVVPVKAMPKGLPLDPNARRPNTLKRVYQKIQASLLGQDCEPGTFHLKNKGITIIADAIEQDGEEYIVRMLHGQHGIVDGGHTYTLIIENLSNPDLPDDQFVTVEIRTGIPELWIPDIAGGLNTSVQVQDMSLDNLKGLFGWIRTALETEPYFSSIAWSENDDGEYDARDLVSLLTMFNIELYPKTGDDHPVAAYEKKSSALKLFEEKSDSYKRMEPIFKDILKLHDTVARDARDMWNRTGGKGGNLAFIEKRKRGLYDFHFTSRKGEYRLMGGALYPILAAFRWYVEQDPKTLKFRWRGGYNNVLGAWDRDGSELLRATKQMSDDLGRNPNANGKSRPHWANLYRLVANKDLMSREGAA